jgi:RHS repeat-associated protein
VDGKDQATVWHYDEYSRVTNKLDQAGSEILRYGYNAGNRLTSRWSAAKGTTSYAYDPVGNLTNIDYPTSTDVHFAYDPLDRLTNMVDGFGTTAYSYTSGGQLASEDGPLANDTVTSTYTNRLRVALSLQQPTGSWTNGFTYDAAHRVSSLTSPAGTFDYSFESTPGPLVSALSLPSGSSIYNYFDAVARLTRTELDTSGSTVLDSASYGYNHANQRTTFTNAVGTYVQYSYDDIGQLKAANSSVNTEDRGYQYDSAWNLNWRTNNGTASQFQVNSLNELTNDPDASVDVYDSNGNLTERWDFGFKIYSYTYDEENRLTSVYYEDFGTPLYESDFAYDGLGRMRARADYYNAIGSELSYVGTTYYTYDGNRVIQERDSNNVPVVSYTRGLDLSGTLEGAGGIGGLLARSSGYSSGNWTSHAFYHADGNGNITYLETSAEGLAASYRYDPFGNTISKSGTLADANTYRFSSKEINIYSGMYYYLYRFYDPAAQRWMGRDPLAEFYDYNLYRFSLNEPTDTIDEDGAGWLKLPKFLKHYDDAQKAAKQAAADRAAAYDSAADPDASPSDLDKKEAKCRASTTGALKKTGEAAIDGGQLPGTIGGGPGSWPKPSPTSPKPAPPISAPPTVPPRIPSPRPVPPAAHVALNP